MVVALRASSMPVDASKAPVKKYLQNSGGMLFIVPQSQTQCLQIATARRQLSADKVAIKKSTFESKPNLDAFSLKLAL